MNFDAPARKLTLSARRVRLCADPATFGDLRSASRPEGEIIKRNVDVHVRALRRKLGDHAGVIETVHGVGYRFREDE